MEDARTGRQFERRVTGLGGLVVVKFQAVTEK